jgi:hypothetical protein
MAELYGRRLALSLPRRFICDLMSISRQVPTIPVQRRMHLATLVSARKACPAPPSWCAIFTKAYGRLAARRPEFRRAYIPFPRPHLYEHPNNIASIAIGRRYGEEDAVFFAHLRCPEQQRLDQIDDFLRYNKEQPVEAIALFRWALKVSRLPGPLRRLLWWFGMNTSGYRRAKWMGTFGLSVYSSLGADSLHPLSPLTTALNYGVIREDGEVDVRIIYDHRVLDGATVARALEELEHILNEETLDSQPPTAGFRRLEDVRRVLVETHAAEPGG